VLATNRPKARVDAKEMYDLSVGERSRTCWRARATRFDLSDRADGRSPGCLRIAELPRVI